MDISTIVNRTSLAALVSLLPLACEDPAAPEPFTSAHIVSVDWETFRHDTRDEVSFITIHTEGWDEKAADVGLWLVARLRDPVRLGSPIRAITARPSLTVDIGTGSCRRVDWLVSIGESQFGLGGDPDGSIRKGPRDLVWAGTYDPCP